MVQGKAKRFTWEEIKEHNTHTDCWVVIHGKVYDVTAWAPHHPGGDIILLGGGRDCTIQYESYHPKGISEKRMNQYLLGELAEGEETHPYDWSSPFYRTMRERVVAAIREAGQPRRGPWPMFVKSALIMAGWLASWYYGMYHGYWAGAALFGFFSSQIGVSIMHDGSHAAYSRWPAVNKVAAWGMDIIGASTVTWEFQHVMGHHPYTNLGSDAAHAADENDPDVFSSFPLVVMHPSDAKRKRWFNHFQHLYAPLLFAFFTMAKTMREDFRCWLSGRVAHISMRNRLSDPAQWARFWVMKSASLAYMALLPALWHGPLKGLGLLAVAHMVCGEFLALMFIVTHVTEGATMVEGDDAPDNKARQAQALARVCAETGVKTTQSVPAMDWAALQCRTSVNWACSSFFWSHVSGALNHQVEHHLFPGICHIHYPLIRPVVKQTCAEFGVPYMEYDTFPAAVGGMLRYLRDVGQGRIAAA